MKCKINNTMIMLALGATILNANAQSSVNLWRGDETRADWNDKYKWKRNHPPQDKESAHFRNPTSVVAVNSTVELNNGIQLYGQELTLVGNGNINLWNPVPHQRTVNIPASATGYANMTLSENLSLNGRIALSGKAFGTSASKGSLTLRNRSTVTGQLLIGNAGNGTGQVFVRDNATYRITGLDLQTQANAGGSAEIHILGGTVRIETTENPFDVFLKDSSRKIVIGDMGTLRIESNIPAPRKKEQIIAMIRQKRLVAGSGCCLKLPVINSHMLIIQAEDNRNSSHVQTTEQLIAAISKIPATTQAKSETQPKLESLLNSMRNQQATTVSAKETSSQIHSKSTKKNTRSDKKSDVHLAGYIVFCGTCLLALRRSAVKEA